jgi:methylmalonyl-CoA mutase
VTDAHTQNARKDTVTKPADELSLASEFPAANRDEWLRLVSGVLKGASFDKKLVAKTYDGVSIEPLYERANAGPIAGRAPGPWQIMQRMDHPEPAAANAEALHDLENGATGLSLTFSGSVGSYGFGLGHSRLDTAIAGIRIDAGIAIELDLGADAEDTLAAVLAAARARQIAPASANIRFGLDPLGAALASGHSPRPLDQVGSHLAETTADLKRQGFRGPFAVADGRVVHNAGGSEAQELGYVLAVAAAYLRALTSAGVALEEARTLIFFRLAADVDQFLTIAKFRALRKLWARVEEACGLAPRPIFISAETAWRVMTKRDPWLNMLRVTMAVVAAGLGGANSVTALPYTMALGLPDRFARRVARNTHLVLLEESNLAKVQDPAAGSGAVEALTHELAVVAWALFQDFERAGVATALAQGMLQDKVAATRAERQHAIALRKDALTGTSEFPDLKETPVTVLHVTAKPIAPAKTRVDVKPVPAFRLAEPFERLRDLSDAHLARTGSRPKVFLANLGQIADFSARSLFAKNFFEAGGIEAVTNDGFVAAAASPNGAPRTDLAALTVAFRASRADLLCLCSSDEVYQTQAISAGEAVRDQGARHVYLAGRPRDLEGALRAAGIQSFIHAGCDVLAMLDAAYRLLEPGQ